MWNKTVNTVKWIYNRPKTSVFLLALLMSLGYASYTRIPAGTKCAYRAMVDQSVPWDLWRFNVATMNCQYYNGTRWIDLFKVMDVSSGSGLTEE